MSDHIRDAKRANSSKLVIGETRGEGTLALLDAMSSGLNGCLVTLHSQPGAGVLAKLLSYACSEGADPRFRPPADRHRRPPTGVDGTQRAGRAGDLRRNPDCQLVTTATTHRHPAPLVAHPGQRWAAPWVGPMDRLSSSTNRWASTCRRRPAARSIDLGGWGVVGGNPMTGPTAVVVASGVALLAVVWWPTSMGSPPRSCWEAWCSPGGARFGPGRCWPWECSVSVLPQDR